MLENIITSKTRLRLMVKFFINAANEGYLRGLASEMNENTNAIRKELNNLSNAGYLIREKSFKKITYKANKKHPLFALLQKIVQKYIGLDTIVEQIIDRVGMVSKVYLVGDYAEGVDSGRIEVVLEGEDLNKHYIQNLAQKIEAEINKKVRITITHHFDGMGLLVFENTIESKR